MEPDAPPTYKEPKRPRPIRLPRKLDARVQAYAKSQGISVLEAVRLLLDCGLSHMQIDGD